MELFFATNSWFIELFTVPNNEFSFMEPNISKSCANYSVFQKTSICNSEKGLSFPPSCYLETIGFFLSNTFALFYSRVGDIERKLKEAEAREEALLRRITEKEKALNKMRWARAINSRFMD